MAKKRKKATPQRRPAAEPPPSRLSQFVQGVLEGMREWEGVAGPPAAELDPMRLCAACGHARRDACGCGLGCMVAGCGCRKFVEPC